MTRPQGHLQPHPGIHPIITHARHVAGFFMPATKQNHPMLTFKSTEDLNKLSADIDAIVQAQPEVCRRPREMGPPEKHLNPYILFTP